VRRNTFLKSNDHEISFCNLLVLSLELIITCNLIYIYCEEFHLLGYTPWSSLKVTDVSEEHVASACYLILAGFLFVLFFDPEDRDDMFL
jgi:hypothetical protein